MVENTVFEGIKRVGWIDPNASPGSILSLFSSGQTSDIAAKNSY